MYLSGRKGFWTFGFAYFYVQGLEIHLKCGVERREDSLDKNLGSFVWVSVSSHHHVGTLQKHEKPHHIRCGEQNFPLDAGRVLGLYTTVTKQYCNEPPLKKKKF